MPIPTGMTDNNAPLDSETSDVPTVEQPAATKTEDNSRQSASDTVATRVTFLIGVIVGLGVSLMFVLGFIAGARWGVTVPEANEAKPAPSASASAAKPTETGVPAPVPSGSATPDAPKPDIAVPAGSAGYGEPLVFGNPEAATTVAVVEDFTCPFCAAFAKETKTAVTDAIASNNFKMEYYPVAFFGDGAFRTAEAAMCAANQGVFFEYSDLLYNNQKPEHGAPSDKELIGFAEQIPVADVAAFTTCLESGEFRPYIDSMNERAQQARVPGTPTVYVNKEMVDPSVLNPQTFIDILSGKPIDNLGPQPLG